MKCQNCGSENIRYVGECYEDDGTVELFYKCKDCKYEGCNSDETDYEVYPSDEGGECTMCGKPVVYGAGGMCASCRTVWNS